MVVTSGTTSEVLLNKLNEKDKMDMRIISAKDHGDSFRTLESGRAVAFMMDDALLAGERAKARNQTNGISSVSHSLRKLTAVCCAKMIRPLKPYWMKPLPAHKRLVWLKKSFDRWFKNPIPPKNLNLNFSLSDEMKALFKAPNDKALN